MGFGAASFILGLFQVLKTLMVWRADILIVFYAYLPLAAAFLVGGFYAYRWGSRDISRVETGMDRPMYGMGLFFFSPSFAYQIAQYLPPHPCFMQPPFVANANGVIITECSWSPPPLSLFPLAVIALGLLLMAFSIVRYSPKTRVRNLTRFHGLS